MRSFLAIIGVAMIGAILYGLVLDQITARICIEYFTIGHRRMFATDSPTAHALYWGIAATWWVGLLLGIPLSFAARAGNRPKLSPRDTIRPVVKLLVVIAVTAVLAGFVGWFLAARGEVVLVGRMAQRVPQERHVAFLTDLWIHNASYLAGFLGGVVLIVYTWRRRKRLAASTAAPVQ